MPYRRLPNTDAARIRALETALNNEEFSNINNLPFSLHLSNHEFSMRQR